MTSPSTADPWELLEARAEIKWLKEQREIDAQVLQKAIQLGAHYGLVMDRAKARQAELEAERDAFRRAYTEATTLCTAANEQRREVEAENERLRAALEPFAELGFVDARAALKPQEPA